MAEDMNYCTPFRNYFAKIFKLPTKLGSCHLTMDKKAKRIVVNSSDRYYRQLKFNQLIVLCAYPGMGSLNVVATILTTYSSLPLPYCIFTFACSLGVIFYHAVLFFFDRDKYEVLISLNGIMEALDKIKSKIPSLYTSIDFDQVTIILMYTQILFQLQRNSCPSETGNLTFDDGRILSPVYISPILLGSILSRSCSVSCTAIIGITIYWLENFMEFRLSSYYKLKFLNFYSTLQFL